MIGALPYELHGQLRLRIWTIRAEVCAPGTALPLTLANIHKGGMDIGQRKCPMPIGLGDGGRVGNQRSALPLSPIGGVYQAPPGDCKIAKSAILLP